MSVTSDAIGPNAMNSAVIRVKESLPDALLEFLVCDIFCTAIFCASVGEHVHVPNLHFTELHQGSRFHAALLLFTTIHFGVVMHSVLL